jgi:cysteine dioxygenase
MNSITSIQQLTEILDDIDPVEHANTMRRIKITAQDLRPYATWSTQGYTRNCLARTSEYEIILLCWDIGAKSAIHGHGGKDCWVYQVEGTLEEKRFEQTNSELIEVKSQSLTPDNLTYMNDKMGYHSIENNSKRQAMTLHIYASPIDSCKVYNHKKDCFEVKGMSYHTYKGNEVETLES